MDRLREEDKATVCDEQESPRHRYDTVPNLLEIENEERGKKNTFCQKYLGMIYSIVCVIGMLASTVITRHLFHYHTSELITYRVMVEMFIMFPILIHQRIKFSFWSEAPLLLLRGTLMSSTYFFFTYSGQSLPLTESLSIMSSTPFVTAILGRIFLKYRLTNLVIMAVVANVIALVLISHFWSGLDRERFLAIGAGFLYVLVYSSSSIVLKILTLDLPPKLVVFYVACMRFVVMLSISEINNEFSVPTIPECSNPWYKSESFLIILMAISILIYSTFEAEATKLENPSTVAAIIAFFTMPLVIISQVIVFREVPSADVIVGVLLVLVAALLINVDGIVEKLSPESTFRRFITKINN